MKWQYFIIAGSVIAAAFISMQIQNKQWPVGRAQGLRYVVIGDSYSNGEGVGDAVAWPVLMTEHLQAEGVPIEFQQNLARSGWTTGDAIQGQLPHFRRLKPTFTTIMLGANDAFQGATPAVFRKNFSTILDEVTGIVPDKRHMFVVTIPDFSLSPEGKVYRLTDRLIREFNDIIKEESAARNIAVIDIFPLSQTLAADRTMFAPDGLHPSEKQLREWERVIFERVIRSSDNKNTVIGVGGAGAGSGDPDHAPDSPFRSLVLHPAERPLRGGCIQSVGGQPDRHDPPGLRYPDEDVRRDRPIILPEDVELPDDDRERRRRAS